MLKTFSGRNASQNEFELRSFIEFLILNGVSRYLEIGARHGDTFHEIMTHLPVGSVGVAVDYPGALWGTVSSRSALTDVNEDLLALGYDTQTLFGDSTNAQVVKAIHALGPFDAILIDGDHTYKGVKADWDHYRDLAPIVAFHDIVGTGQMEKVRKNPVEVPILWNEIRTSGDYPAVVEFIDIDSKMGIGVVCKK